ncbi:S-adenosyl-L-methionine-dependent methyltransferase [Myxozyma melibiosi]|uniref:Protein arginine methyltransferase NDUFAF7 n=1 Tax=Myxozyma melibiosi TaxID=54550 RepID=A0ABR1F3I4_9ASCO
MSRFMCLRVPSRGLARSSGVKMWMRPGRATTGLRPYASTAPEPAVKKSLGEILASAIKTTGPISLAAYMRQCLTNPESGYYINKDPFGAGGDFITSPEISQMFGELVGIWVLTQWMAVSKPDESRLIELGPGRGTLMADMLKAFQSFGYFNHTVKEICLVEASPTLREMQHKLLCGEEPLEETEYGHKSRTKYGQLISWYMDLKTVPKDDCAPFIIAHEFFDALPIHQFEHTQHGWRELLVDYSVPKVETPLSLPNQTTSIGPEVAKFHLTVPAYATASSRVIPSSSERYKKLPIHSKIEVSPESWDVALEIAKRIQETDELGRVVNAGSALIVDYGPADTIPVDSLRAIKQHHIVSPFEEPGAADLSADVDFVALKEVARKEAGVDVHGPVEQGDWLHTLGIGARATVLANKQTTQEGKDRIAKAYNRLVERSGGAMGKVYKVMAFTPKGSPVPVGFGGEVVE